VAFLLEEMEDTQINESLRLALDSQMTEFTMDMKTLIEDAKEKFSEHVKATETRIDNLPAKSTEQRTPQSTTYASMLVNPPAHANPRVAAKEGIKARQFSLEGLKNSKFSHLDTLQLKSQLNNILLESGLQSGKLRSVINSRGGSTIIETDTDATAVWLANTTNQRKICELIGPSAEFRTRSYNLIALNVPIDINPDEANHRQEITEANDLDTLTITTAKWAKAVDRRSPNQRTAHLLLTFNSAEAANRAITNGLTICNRRCRIERTRREPTRCLKCQGWNHFARECLEEKDTCGNCAGPHRTSSCHSNERNCASCKSSDHASWSRKCPTFTRKLDEFNARNPDNSLLYFPTADPWTWSAPEKHSSTSMTAPTPPPQLSNTQKGKRPQQARGPTDTYIPNRQDDRHTQSRQNGSNTPYGHTDTYIPNHQTDWGSDPGPSNPRPTNTATQRPARTSGGTAQSSNRTPTPLPSNNA
jgi:hypothetical protein